MNIPRVAVFLMAVSLLGGCEAGAGFANRYGPDPAMPTTTVVASTDHQVAIMRKLAEAANCASPPIPQGTDEYRECLYRTTLVGFNFVDEQCDAYLHELFALDKERDRAKSAVSSAGLLTNAVLAVSPASKMTMAIAAQAFGLSASFIDVATDSYLFKTNPGVIFNIVATLQAQYRDNVAANKTLMIDSLPASYGAIRGYLRLCMPPTIESKVTAVLAQATAKPPEKSGKGPGSLQNVDLNAQ